MLKRTLAATALLLGVAMIGSNLAVWTSPWLREQGDIAANALQMDRAAEGRELLGPYSQHGFHHPGPAIFYIHAAADPLFAFLPTRMAERLSVQLALNLAALAVAAWLLRRSGLPGPAAILALFVLVAPTVFLAGGNMFLLASTWGPLVVVAPMVLCVTAAARLAEGDLIAAPFAAAAATLAWHTHLATIPPLLAVMAVTTAWLGWKRPIVAPAPASRTGRALLVASAGLALAGIIPLVVEEARGHPGNLTLIARFLRETPPATHPWAEIAAKLGPALTDPLVVLFPAAATWLGSAPVAVGLGAVLLALSVAGFRRSQRPWRLVILFAWIVVGMALLTARRLHGELHAYVFYYLYGMVGLLQVIAASAACAHRPAAWRLRVRSRAWPAAVAGLAVAGLAVAGLAVAVPWLLCHRVPAPAARDDVAAAVAALGLGQEPSLHLSLGTGERDGELWHLVPTFALHLQRAGIAVTVDERFVVVCGEGMRASPASLPVTTIRFTREDPAPGQAGRFDADGWSAVAIPASR